MTPDTALSAQVPGLAVSHVVCMGMGKHQSHLVLSFAEISGGSHTEGALTCPYVCKLETSMPACMHTCTFMHAHAHARTHVARTHSMQRTPATAPVMMMMTVAPVVVAQTNWHSANRVDLLLAVSDPLYKYRSALRSA